MNHDDRQKLREVAITAQSAPSDRWNTLHTGMPKTSAHPWELQTSNSFRRIGAIGDGDVLCATTHPSDRQPDLFAPPGVLDYIVATQPHVVISLLDELDAAEDKLQQSFMIIEKIAEIETRLAKFHGVITEAVEKLSTLEDVSIAEARDLFASLQAAFTEVPR